MRDVILKGMLGLGDNLHQRAVVRQMMQRGRVWLETPWPSLYQDLAGDRLQLLPVRTRLRTQAKNVARSSGLYSQRRPPVGLLQQRVWYTHDQIRRQGGFLSAMCAYCGVPKGDFSLPVPQAWQEKARTFLPCTSKPLLVYRPLVNRTEWDGCRQRNPDPEAYTSLLNHIREQFFVVSIADLKPGVEWIESAPIGADLELHAGELDVEALAGMVSLADLVWCSPGFMLVMAQAIRKPMVAVFGGHESARLYDHGFTENHFIQPIDPCECFSKSHACNKKIEMEEAKKALVAFVEDLR